MYSIGLKLGAFMIKKLVGSVALLACVVATTDELSAQPTLLDGDYVSSFSVPYHPLKEILVSNNGTGNTVRLHAIQRGPGQCVGDWDIVAFYTLPPGYKGEVLNFTSASCSGVWVCGAIELICSGVEASPWGFRQINKEQIAGGGPTSYETFSRRGTPPRVGKRKRPRKPDYKFAKDQPSGKRFRNVIVRLRPN
jgi:hypothetical protein